MYHDILKLFYMYVEGVFGVDELLILIEPLFDDKLLKIYENFKSIVVSREVNRRDQTWLCK